MFRATLLGIAGLICAQPLWAWSARVTPSNASLPPIHVSLGYTAQYVPEVFCPVEIRTEQVPQRFDGFIGYHLAVGDKTTRDVAHATRAVIEPGGQWQARNNLLMVTEFNDGHPARELIIDWRDRKGKVIASASAGIPPWSKERRPLRVASPGEVDLRPLHFGQESVVLPASALPADAVWYRGFSSVVMPAALWFSLPAPVRQALFRSGTETAMFGIPARVSPMPAYDQAMFPVHFTAGSARPKPETVYVGSETSPQLVLARGAVWAADEPALREVRPAFEAEPFGHRSYDWQKSWSLADVAATVRFYAPAVAGVVALIVTIALWWPARRAALLPVIAIAALVACTQPFYRNWIARWSGMATKESWEPLRPGAVQRTWTEEAYGRTPLNLAPAARRSAVPYGLIQQWGRPLPHLSLSGGDGSSTAFYNGEWGSAARRLQQMELSAPVAVTVRAADQNRLELDYALPEAPFAVWAIWMSSAGIHHSMARPAGGRNGRVALRNAVVSASGNAFEREDDFRGDLRRAGRDFPILVGFHCGDEARQVSYHWYGSRPGTGAFIPYTIWTALRRNEKDLSSAAFVLPDAALPDATKLRISTYSTSFGVARGGLTVEGDRGSVQIKPDGGSAYLLSAEEFSRVSSPHSVVRATLSKPVAKGEETGRMVITVGARFE